MKNFPKLGRKIILSIIKTRHSVTEGKTKQQEKREMYETENHSTWSKTEKGLRTTNSTHPLIRKTKLGSKKDQTKTYS